MKLKSVLIVYTIPRTKEQKISLHHVQRVLRKYRIVFELANRDKLNELRERFAKKDLIIAVGGDGTFLRAAQFIRDIPILGVNADIKNKEGFLMSSDKYDFEGKLKRIEMGDFEIRKLARLEAQIDGRKLPVYALNEFFIGPKKSYHASKYEITVKGKSEVHKSSGIIVATATGSHAWAKACHGKVLSLNSSDFQYVVREPFEGKVFRNYKLKSGILKRNEALKIKSEMLDGMIIADSVGREYDFKDKSRTVIMMSKNPVKQVYFKSR